MLCKFCANEKTGCPPCFCSNVSFHRRMEEYFGKEVFEEIGDVWGDRGYDDVPERTLSSVAFNFATVEAPPGFSPKRQFFGHENLDSDGFFERSNGRSLPPATPQSSYSGWKTSTPSIGTSPPEDFTRNRYFTSPPCMCQVCRPRVPTSNGYSNSAWGHHPVPICTPRLSPQPSASGFFPGRNSATQPASSNAALPDLLSGLAVNFLADTKTEFDNLVPWSNDSENRNRYGYVGDCFQSGRLSGRTWSSESPITEATSSTSTRGSTPTTGNLFSWRPSSNDGLSNWSSPPTDLEQELPDPTYLEFFEEFQRKRSEHQSSTRRLDQHKSKPNPYKERLADFTLGGWSNFLAFSKDYERENRLRKERWVAPLYSDKLQEGTSERGVLVSARRNECASPCHKLINGKDPGVFSCTACRQTRSYHVFEKPAEEPSADESLEANIERMRQAIKRQPIANFKVKPGSWVSCNFCRTNSEKREFYQSHALRSGSGIVTCPVLRTIECPHCYTSGDYAHTKNYCKRFSVFKEKLPTVRRLANGALASASHHK